MSLSDVVPTFEHMGAKVVDERPYEITPSGEEPVYIYDFGLRCDAQEIELARTEFEAAFLGVWRGELEDDGFNELVIRARLTGREVTIIRAVARYLRQAGIAFSDAYIDETLVGTQPSLALLVDLFRARFDPDATERGAAARWPSRPSRRSTPSASLDEDRILRSFLAVVQATVRTNYYRRATEGAQRRGARRSSSTRRKFPHLPRARPRFEIFVYCPRVEGVHLRGGKVARGGLRWSDRREDFRTEVLGLMKAQMVKNAVIVPGRAPRAASWSSGRRIRRPPRPAGGGSRATAASCAGCST